MPSHKRRSLFLVCHRRSISISSPIIFARLAWLMRRPSADSADGGSPKISNYLPTPSSRGSGTRLGGGSKRPRPTSFSRSRFSRSRSMSQITQGFSNRVSFAPAKGAVKDRQRTDPATGLVTLADAEELQRAAVTAFVATARVWDLLVHAKRLFVAASLLIARRV